MNLKALLKSNKKLIFKFCLLIGCFLIMTLFIFNNESFYKKMGWGIEETKQRNDKLFTIYSIISEYINNQDNGVYLPMETMYSRSKVMTKNNVCTMYLHK